MLPVSFAALFLLLFLRFPFLEMITMCVCGLWSAVFLRQHGLWLVIRKWKITFFILCGMGCWIFSQQKAIFFLRFIRVKRKSVILNSIQFRVEFRSLKIYGCTAGHLQLNVAFDTVMYFFRFCSYHSSHLRQYHQRISWSAREHYHQSVIWCHDSLF